MLGVLLAGCIPDDHSTWLLDRPYNWGLHVSVVQPGPYASDLIVPEDRVRAVPLPLDTLDLQWRVLVPADGPPLPPPIWIACAEVCPHELSSLQTELEPECPTPLPLSRARPCRLGVGEQLRVVLGGVYTAGDTFQGQLQFMAVGSADPDLSPEACLEGLARTPYPDLDRCLVQTRILALGPLWKLNEVAPQLVKERFIDVPSDIHEEPADTHPVLLGVDVVRRSASGTVELLAADGASVPMRPGERITLRARFADDARQAFYRPRKYSGDLYYTFVPTEERVWVEYVFGAVVEDLDWDFQAHERSFTVPHDSGPIDVHLRAVDSRQGRAYFTVHLVPEEGLGGPP